MSMHMMSVEIDDITFNKDNLKTIMFHDKLQTLMHIGLLLIFSNHQTELTLQFT